MVGDVLLVVCQSQTVDVAGEGAEAALEGERDVGTAALTVVDNVVDLQVGVKVGALLVDEGAYLEGYLVELFLDGVVVRPGVVSGLVVVLRGDDGGAAPGGHDGDEQHEVEGCQEDVPDGHDGARVEDVGGPHQGDEHQGEEEHAAGVVDGEVVGVGVVGVAALTYPVPHLPHGERAVAHHDEALGGDDVLPEVQALAAHEAEGEPGVEHGDEHRGDDHDGGSPANALPAGPLLDGTGEAEHEQTAVEVVDGGEVGLHQRPGGLVGGVDDVGYQHGRDGVDEALQLAVGPDVGVALLGGTAGVEPAYDGERPAGGQI